MLRSFVNRRLGKKEKKKGKQLFQEEQTLPTARPWGRWQEDALSPELIQNPPLFLNLALGVCFALGLWVVVFFFLSVLFFLFVFFLFSFC